MQVTPEGRLRQVPLRRRVQLPARHPDPDRLVPLRRAGKVRLHQPLHVVTSGRRQVTRRSGQEPAPRDGLPVVVVDEPIAGLPPVPTVVMDDYAGGYQATSYLVAPGHRTIALVSGPAPPGPVTRRVRRDP